MAAQMIIMVMEAMPPVTVLYLYYVLYLKKLVMRKDIQRTHISFVRFITALFKLIK